MEPLKMKVALRDEFCIETVPDPCGIVIFGGSGDLAHRKLIPSLFRLSQRGLLPQDFYLLGCLSYGASPATDEAFRAAVRATLESQAPAPAGAVDAFAARCFYLPGDYREPSFYRALAERTGALDAACATGGCRLFYLAVPPALQEPVVGSLVAAGLARESEDRRQWARVVVEKPFGRDLASARALSRRLSALLAERQIYRIETATMNSGAVSGSGDNKAESCAACSRDETAAAFGPDSTLRGARRTMAAVSAFNIGRHQHC